MRAAVLERPAGEVEAVITTEVVETRLREREVQARWEGSPPRAFRALVHDSRRVGPDDLFCAVTGTKSDGHDFLAQAEAAGAAAAIVERVIEGASLPQLVVTDSRAALAHLAQLWAGDPADELCLVGITGTNGKTTTAWIVRHALAELEPTAALGTLGVVDAEGRTHPGELTTPDPLTLAERLAELKDAGTAGVAMEVSSHALDQRRVEGLRFDYGVFTSFSREHLDYHGDMSAYLEAKLRLPRLLRDGATCVVNADEPAWEALEPGGAEVVTTGIGAGADVRAEGIEIAPAGTRFRLTGRYGEADVLLPLLGDFNVRNALAAAGVALHRGIAVERVAERLSSTPQVPGRFEVLAHDPFLIVRDYAHTPDALDLVLSALRPLTAGRLLIVFGCGGDRDRGKRPEMGRIAQERADHVFITSDNPRTEDPARIAAEVTAGMVPGGFEVVLDRREAIARALAMTEPGDVLLLAGKGHETYQIVGTAKEPFDEPAIVAELLGGGEPSEAGGGAVVDHEGSSREADDHGVSSRKADDREARP